MIKYIQKLRVFLLICICLLLTNCATLRLEEIAHHINEKDGIKIKMIKAIKGPMIYATGEALR